MNQNDIKGLPTINVTLDDWLAPDALTNAYTSLSKTYTDSIMVTTNAINTISIDDTWASSVTWESPVSLGSKICDSNGEATKNTIGTLIERIEKLEKISGILCPNEEFENKWAELKNARSRYETILDDLIEKDKAWKILKR